VPKKQGEKNIYVCRCCGAEQTEENNHTATHLICESIKKDNEKVKIFNENAEKEKLPTIKHVCPKCHNTKAVFWIKQTRRSDEPPTRFYKCLNCGYICREYE